MSLMEIKSGSLFTSETRRLIIHYYSSCIYRVFQSHQWGVLSSVANRKYQLQQISMLTLFGSFNTKTQKPDLIILATILILIIHFLSNIMQPLNGLPAKRLIMSINLELSLKFSQRAFFPKIKHKIYSVKKQDTKVLKIHLEIKEFRIHGK